MNRFMRFCISTVRMCLNWIKRQKKQMKSTWNQFRISWQIIQFFFFHSVKFLVFLKEKLMNWFQLGLNIQYFKLWNCFFLYSAHSRGYKWLDGPLSKEVTDLAVLSVLDDISESAVGEKLIREIRTYIIFLFFSSNLKCVKVCVNWRSKYLIFYERLSNIVEKKRFFKVSKRKRLVFQKSTLF